MAGATQVLSVGDWNRDGKGDVITRQDEGDTLMLRPGAGNGTFGAGVLMSKGWSTFAKLTAVGDVTGDRFPDLMGKTATGPMTVFPGNGKTSFRVPMLAPASLRTFNQIAAGGLAAGRPPGLGVPQLRRVLRPLRGHDGRGPGRLRLGHRAR